MAGIGTHLKNNDAAELNANHEMTPQLDKGRERATTRRLMLLAIMCTTLRQQPRLHDIRVFRLMFAE